MAGETLAHAQWRQTLLSDLLEKTEAQALLASLLGRISVVTGQSFKPDEFSCVLHWGSAEEVPRHRDSLAKTCFLIPLQCPRTLAFYEGYQRCAVWGKKLIRFNDFEDHGLSNPFRGHFYLLTLSRDRL